jgi:hypothetical protein
MQHRTSPARFRRSRSIAVASFLVVATVAALPASLGAASNVQKCAAPLPSAQSGRQTFAPGINDLATAQTVASKVNLFQCSDTKKTGRSGVLTTSLKTAPITCDVFTSAHVWNFAGSIKWVNKKTSTLKLAFATSGASRLATVTGSVTAGVYAGHTVTAQFKWKPIVSPAGKKFPDACANTVKVGDAGRVKISGDEISTTQPFTVH